MAIGTPPIGDAGDGKPVSTPWGAWFMALWRAVRGWRESYAGSVTINFGSIAANSQASSAGLVIAEAKTTDVFLCSADVNTAGIHFDAFCATDGVVTIRAMNFTAGSVDPASATFRVIGFKQ